MMMAHDMTGFIAGLLITALMIGIVRMFGHRKHLAAMRGSYILRIGRRRDNNCAKQYRQHDK